jgi:hypothetical protein
MLSKGISEAHKYEETTKSLYFLIKYENWNESHGLEYKIYPFWPSELVTFSTDLLSVPSVGLGSHSKSVI